MTDNINPKCIDLMMFLSEKNLQDDILYCFHEGKLCFESWQNDWFGYACSYCVEISPDDLPLLRKCVEACESAYLYHGHYGVKLFCCLKENLPPLKEYFKVKKYRLPKPLLPLFGSVSV